MKTMTKRTVLAMVALVSLAVAAGAEEWRFAELGNQLMGQPGSPAMGSRGELLDATEVSTLSQEGGEELPQLEANPFHGESISDAFEFCTDGACGSCEPCGPCGECGECDDCCAPACGGCCACGEPACCGTCCQKDLGTCYVEMQVMFLRPHIVEEAAGKLSEKYEFSPRFVLGYESPGGVGLRGRYWTYGRTTPNLDSDEDPLRFEFEVLDVEGTSRFRTDRSELTLAGGMRWADMEIESDDDGVGGDMPGITFAVDGRHAICRGCNWHFAGVAGARWSMLGGDWEGDDDALIEPTRDDNVVVHEIYGGVEFLRSCGSCDFYTRAVFEVQNWHSDALGDSSDADSISFVGPGVHAGVDF